MGTPEFAVPSLDILVENGLSVAAVVTAPDKPRGRGRQLSPTPVKERALHHGISVLQPQDLRDPAFVQALQALNPDLIVVVAYRILPKEIFSVPRLGTFNLHASLLPKYRGAAPINWALIKGESETGVTTFFLQETVDTGNVILQKRMPILDNDDAGSLHDELSVLGATTVLETVRLIEQGRAQPVPQDSALACPAPKIFKEDCLVVWQQSAIAIHNRVRGLSPYPAAFTTHRGRILKVYRTRVLDTQSPHAAGIVTVTDTSLHVATADEELAILELQQEGKRRMGVEEFLRGYVITTGELLG